MDKLTFRYSIFLLILPLIVALNSAQSYGQGQCQNPLEKVNKTNSDITELPSLADLGVDVHDAIGLRAFLGTFPNVTPVMKRVFAKNLIIEWRSPVYIMPSFEAAQAHANAERNLLLKPTYLIVPGFDLAKHFNHVKASQIDVAEARKLFARLLNDPNVYMIEPDPTKLSEFKDGELLTGATQEDYLGALREVIASRNDSEKTLPLTFAEKRQLQLKIYGRRNLQAATDLPYRIVPRDRVLRIMNPDVVTIHDDVGRTEIYPDGSTGPSEKFFYQPGYAAREVVGLVSRENVRPESTDAGGKKHGSVTYDKISKIIRMALAKGYLITFNGGSPENLEHTAKEIFELLSVQERRTSHFLTGASLEMDPATNRYPPDRVEKNIANWIEDHRKGLNFSIEIWSPKHPETGERVLLGASPGNRIGEYFEPDTVLYNRLFIEAVQAETKPESMGDGENGFSREKLVQGVLSRLNALPQPQRDKTNALFAYYRKFVRESVEAAVKADSKVSPYDVFLKQPALDYAKMPLIILMMMLTKNGTYYYDAGMKTPMTEATAKSEYVPRNQAAPILLDLMARPAVSLVGSGVWTYEQSPEYVEPVQKVKGKKK